MPVSVVVGGQYGSEGKGKVALELVRNDPTISMVVRPGGTNSGHTGYSRAGRRVVVRQLPAAAIDRSVKVVLPAGSYIDIALLQQEIAELGISSSQIAIDPRAQIIRPEHIKWEESARLTDSIGSTASGTGAAVLSRIARFAPGMPDALQASEVPELQDYLIDSQSLLTSALQNGERILIEGTQGFGLSPLHGDNWPCCTSRDTTAAAFVSEAGLSPLSVDQVVVVFRCHPIRVAGQSGPLLGETTWQSIQNESGAPGSLTEYTSVTKRVRRVGEFDFNLARRAIAANLPTTVVLNHLDYIDWDSRTGLLTETSRSFVKEIEKGLDRRVDLVGTNEQTLLRRHQLDSALC